MNQQPQPGPQRPARPVRARPGAARSAVRPDRALRPVLAAALATLLIGCAAPRQIVPVPQAGPGGDQLQAQAAADVRQAAREQARAVAAALAGSGRAGPALQLRPLPGGGSPFAQAWLALLRTELLAAGLRLDEAAPLHLEPELQPLVFAPGRANLPPPFEPDHPLARPIPQHELLIHLSLREGGQILARHSQLLYLRDADAALVRPLPRAPAPRTVGVR